jgi:O-antigen/teichoic acid export membrane protein
MVLFPAFSALRGMGEQQRLEALLVRSVKYILLTLGPIVAMIALFAREVLGMWLGADFATQSSLVLQLLAVGVLVNSIAHVPVVFLQGIGRPDVIGKVHIVEVPFYVGLAWALVSRFGLAGAAAAWTCRIAADGLLLFVMAHRVGRLSLRALANEGLALTAVALVAFVGLVCALRTFAGGLPPIAQAALLTATVACLGWVLWRNALDMTDRELVFKMGKALRLPWGAG